MKEVIEGDFQDMILIDGDVESINLVLVNTLEGGTVDEIFIEDGVMVEKGTPLLRLSNPSVTLGYMNQETAIMEQINNLRNLRLSLEKEQINLAETLIDSENKLAEAERSYKVDSVLFSKDIIARNDFVEKHVKYRKFGYFLSGGYYKLSMALSKSIEKADILTGRCFDLAWLKRNGLKASFKNNKLDTHGLKSYLLNKLTPTSPTWNGHNSSGWKKDIIKVNGLDERMKSGGQDRELGDRLVKFGIKPKQRRYSAIVLYLDHARGYKSQNIIDKNYTSREKTRNEKQ